jgi:peptidoglycan/xylan/chitin deacetylase (PgdA/CDA1 family)
VLSVTACGTRDALPSRVRIVLFSVYRDYRLNAWCTAIRDSGVASELCVVLTDYPACPAPTVDELRRWRPDCGVVLGDSVAPLAMTAIPSLGTLQVRLGHGPDDAHHGPGFWELWYGESEVRAAVTWIDQERAGQASARAPIYARDSWRDVSARADELGQALLTTALRRVARGRNPGKEPAVAHSDGPVPTPFQRLVFWYRQRWRDIRRHMLQPRTVGKLAFARCWLAVVRPLRDLIRTVFGLHPVRVFTLHRVTGLCRDGMTVAPSVFRRQVEYLRRHHDVVDLDRALTLIERKQRLRRPVAVITFDDGYESVRQAAFPILASVGAVGSVFVCPDIVDADDRFEHDKSNALSEWFSVMGWDAIRELRKAGWHIGSHTATHARLSTLSGPPLVRELRESRAALSKRLGSPPITLAYPFGGQEDITAEGVEAARQCGYAALLSDYGGENAPGADWFALRRTDIGGDHDTVMWQSMVHGLDLRRWRPKRSA